MKIIIRLNTTYDQLPFKNYIQNQFENDYKNPLRAELMILM